MLGELAGIQAISEENLFDACISRKSLSDWELL